MKIEKKFKTFLLSSLTIFASAISVVGCGSKDEGDQNYKDFVLHLEKIDPRTIYFPGNNTSVHDFYTNNTTANEENYRLTNAKIDLDNLKFYDISGFNDEKKVGTKITASLLTSLKDGGITYDMGGNVLFNGVSLDNILFAENFDLNLFNVDHQPDEHGMIFKNVTLFFGITANKKNVSVEYWWNFSKPDKKPQFNVNAITPDFFQNIGLDPNHGFNDSYNFGIDIDNNHSYEYVGPDPSTGTDIKWNFDNSVKKQFVPSLFTVADDNLTIGKPSEAGKPFNFNFNATSVIGQFTVSGKANKGAINTEANFLGLFNKNNLKLNINGNYFVAINLDKK